MADQRELTISDIHGSVTRDSPDVYITFRVGDEHVETPVRCMHSSMPAHQQAEKCFTVCLKLFV